MTKVQRLKLDVAISTELIYSSFKRIEYLIDKLPYELYFLHWGVGRLKGGSLWMGV